MFPGVFLLNSQFLKKENVHKLRTKKSTYCQTLAPWLCNAAIYRPLPPPLLVYLWYSLLFCGRLLVSGANQDCLQHLPCLLVGTHQDPEDAALKAVQIPPILQMSQGGRVYQQCLVGFASSVEKLTFFLQSFYYSPLMQGWYYFVIVRVNINRLLLFKEDLLYSYSCFFSKVLVKWFCGH